jgi:DNA-binding transcriptional regulator YiaG
VRRKITPLEQAYARNLGAWICEQRNSLKLSQSYLGSVVGVNYNTIRSWEQGRAIPNVYQYSLIKRLVKKAEAAQ